MLLLAFLSQTGESVMRSRTQDIDVLLSFGATPSAVVSKSHHHHTLVMMGKFSESKDESYTEQSAIFTTL
jgi:hypothetical protein